MATGEKRPTGRPQLYTEEIAEEILRRVGEGESLVAVCESDHLPHRQTVHRWILGQSGAPQSFCDRYAVARQRRAEFLAEQILMLSDQAEDADSLLRINALRVMIDGRKWFAARVDPKHWGDRVQHDVGGQRDNPVKIDIAPDPERAKKIANTLLELEGSDDGGSDAA